VSFLRGRGFEVIVEDNRPPVAENQPDETLALAATGSQRRLFDALAREPLGQIQVRGDRHSLECIGNICRSFPMATILIVAAGERRCGWIRRELSRMLRRPVDLVRSGSVFPHNPVIVSTSRQIGIYGPGKVNILVVVDAAEMAGKRMTDYLTMQVPVFPRRYALVHRCRRLSDGERLAVEAVTGPLIHGLEKAPALVRVLTCRALAFPKVKAPDPLQYRRLNIWHHRERNELIARTARAVAGHDLKTLWELGLFLEAPDESWLRSAKRPSIYILVESLEHARELHELLPDWAVVAHREPHVDTAPDQAIITCAWALKRRPQPDVLLRAGDEPHRKQFPGHRELLAVIHPAGDHDAGRQYVIDFDDHIDQTGRPALGHRDSHRNPLKYADAKLSSHPGTRTASTVPGETRDGISTSQTTEHAINIIKEVNPANPPG
jgi:hypothetical protein